RSLHAVDGLNALKVDIPVCGEVLAAATEAECQESFILLAIRACGEDRLLLDGGLIVGEFSVLVQNVFRGRLTVVRLHVGNHLRAVPCAPEGDGASCDLMALDNDGELVPAEIRLRALEFLRRGVHLT